MAIDPVCGMTIDPKNDPWAETSMYKGKKYYFCDKADKNKFVKDPEKYLAKKK